MEETTTRRNFFKGAFFGILGVVPILSGCIAPRVSSSARDNSLGQPWRCDNCGHLTRSTDDLSNHRCPRCYAKKLMRVTEEQFAKFLKKEQTAK